MLMLWHFPLPDGYLFIYFLFCFFRPALVACEGSQARGLTPQPQLQDLSRVCDLHHSSGQCLILNLLSESRNRTCNLMVPSRLCFCFTMMGTFQWLLKKRQTYYLVHITYFQITVIALTLFSSTENSL